MPASLRLTPRDLAVLATLSEYRFASVPQLRALHDAAPRRLADLAHAGILARVFMPVQPHDRAVTSIYALSRDGARELAVRRGGPVPAHLAASDRRSALFLDHTLQRNDLHAVLNLLNRTARGFVLRAWRQAPDDIGGGADLRGRDGTSWVACVPDGFVHAEVAGEEHGIAVEIDMGTVAPMRMERRYRAYYAWWKTGGMAKRLGSMPLRVLTLTTTPARCERLRSAAIRASPGCRGSGLFWFGLLSCADLDHPERLLTAPFRTARRCDDDTLRLFR